MLTAFTHFKLSVNWLSLTQLLICWHHCFAQTVGKHRALDVRNGNASIYLALAQQQTAGAASDCDMNNNDMNRSGSHP